MMLPSETVQLLKDKVGATAAAFAITGEPSAAVLLDHCIDGRTHLSAEQIRRAEVALRLFQRVADAEKSDDTARAWLIGSSIDTDTDVISPLEAIATDHFADAEASANAMINDSTGY